MFLKLIKRMEDDSDSSNFSKSGKHLIPPSESSGSARGQNSCHSAGSVDKQPVAAAAEADGCSSDFSLQGGWFIPPSSGVSTIKSQNGHHHPRSRGLIKVYLN